VLRSRGHDDENRLERTVAGRHQATVSELARTPPLFAFLDRSPSNLEDAALDQCEAAGLRDTELP